MRLLLSLFFVLFLIRASAFEKELDRFQVPGVAIAVVHKGEVVYLQGHGLRNIENQLPVTPDTIFPIASLTKAMTSHVIEELAFEGKLRLDERVIHYLPEFRLWDKRCTKRATLRDLLTHQTGLPKHDAIWFKTPEGSMSSDFVKSGLLGSLQHLEPICKLRESFQYNNLMYALAGVALERVTGKSWEQTIQERIFEPLGMQSSGFSVQTACESGNYATLYDRYANQLIELPPLDLSIVGAAGSINASLNDCVSWLQFKLSKPAPKVEVTNLRRAPYVPTAGVREVEGYGLGWYIEKYRGQELISHGGRFKGCSSYLGMLPEEQLGIVILSNTDHSGPLLTTALAYTLIDKYLGHDDVDWIMLHYEVYQRWQASQKPKERGAIDRPLKDYVGSYTHPGYGTISIELVEDTLMANYYRLQVPLRPVKENTFEAIHPMIMGRDFVFTDHCLEVAFEPKLDPIQFFAKSA